MRAPAFPPTVAQGNLLVRVSVPSPLAVDLSPNVSIHNIDARQLRQQTFFVNQDRSAEMMETVEMNHQALMAEQNQHFNHIGT